MVDSKETAKKSLKDLLKNKKVIKGTPLHRYANRYAGYFVLSLGCAHLSVWCVVHNSDVDDYWIKSGPEYVSRKTIQLGMFDRRVEDTERKIDEIADDFKHTRAYTIYTVVSQYFNDFKGQFFSSSHVDAASQPSETIKGASTLTSPSPISSTVKDTSQ